MEAFLFRLDGLFSVESTYCPPSSPLSQAYLGVQYRVVLADRLDQSQARLTMMASPTQAD